jgi:hypothetical protein
VRISVDTTWASNPEKIPTIGETVESEIQGIGGILSTILKSLTLEQALLMLHLRQVLFQPQIPFDSSSLRLVLDLVPTQPILFRYITVLRQISTA